VSQPTKDLSQDDRTAIERGRRRLVQLLLALAALLVALVVLAALAPSRQPAPEWLGSAVLAAVGLFVVLSWWLIFAIGSLANRVGRSPIVWGGLAFLSSGFGGSLIAAFLIRHHATAALASGKIPVRS
jgi:hypothetical protein